MSQGHRLMPRVKTEELSPTQKDKYREREISSVSPLLANFQFRDLKSPRKRNCTVVTLDPFVIKCVNSTCKFPF